MTLRKRLPLLVGLVLVNGALLLWPRDGRATLLPTEKVAMGSCGSCYDAGGNKMACCIALPCSACNCRQNSNC
ncbi:MAG TPA: hypothetical protein VEQ60_08445 [Longimicrobium sp.]|nr:hypothetical protein [Longimicrobium sp.]